MKSNFKANLKDAFTLEGAKRNGIWFFHSLIWLFVVIFVIDIASKWAVQVAWSNPMNLNESRLTEPFVIIPNFLVLDYELNLGAAFGLGSNGDIAWRITWILVSVIMTGALIAYYIWKFKSLNMITRVGLMMMIAGAFGNMIDRLFYWKAIVGFDGVIDWIHFTFGRTYFNIADSSLVIGVIVLIIALIVDAVKESKKKRLAGVYDVAPSELEENKDNSAVKTDADIKVDDKSQSDIKINVEYVKSPSKDNDLADKKDNEENHNH